MTPESAITPESLAALFTKHNVRPIRQEHLCDWGTAYRAGADVLGILAIVRHGGDVSKADAFLEWMDEESARSGRPLTACMAVYFGLDAGFLRGLDLGWMEGWKGPLPAGSGPRALGIRVGAEAAARLMPAPGVGWVGNEG